MKKLMIAAFAVAFAAVAQAASIQWNSGAITLADGTSAGASVAAKLFVIDAVAYGALIDSAVDGKTLSDAVYTKYSTATADVEKQSAKKGSAANLADANEYSIGDTAYAAILYTYTDGNGVEQYMGNIGSYQFDADSDIPVAGMSAKIFGSDIGTVDTAWSTAAVPEPTSALMLLVGLAGLALKRKIA